MINEEHARKYCSEDPSLIENYESAMNDKTQTWHCHHRNIIVMNCSSKELKAQGLYENRPAHELIFLPPSEHHILHNRNPSLETRAKLSAAKKGNKAFLGHKHTEETRARISATSKGRKLSAETRAKMSAAQKGRKNALGLLWWNNGVMNKKSKECPGPEWKRGRV